MMVVTTMSVRNYWWKMEALSARWRCPSSTASYVDLERLWKPLTPTRSSIARSLARRLVSRFMHVVSSRSVVFVNLRRWSWSLSMSVSTCTRSTYFTFLFFFLWFLYSCFILLRIHFICIFPFTFPLLLYFLPREIATSLTLSIHKISSLPAHIQSDFSMSWSGLFPELSKIRRIIMSTLTLWSSLLFYEAFHQELYLLPVLSI